MTQRFAGVVLPWSIAAFFVAASGCGPPPSDEAPGERWVTIVHTADLHSHLFDEPLVIGASDAARGLGPEGHTVRVGGVARIATVLDELAEQATEALYVDAGDLLEGTSSFPRFGGVPEMRAASLLGLEAAALGNHDVALGTDALASLVTKEASFPLLDAGGVGEGAFAPSMVVVKNGVRVGVIGLGRSPSGPPRVEAAAEAVERARNTLGAVDVTVLLSHLGSELDVALVPLTTGLHVVIGGHSHDVLEPPARVLDASAREVTVLHAGAYGRYVGRVDLALAGEPLVVTDVRPSTWPVSEPTLPRADVEQLLAPYAAALDAAGFGRAVAFAPSPVSRKAPKRGDSALGNVYARALRLAARADLAVVPTSGVRADLPAGESTRDDWARVLPFDDTVIAGTVSGRVLLRALMDKCRSACASGAPSPVQIDGGTLSVRCASTEVAVTVDGEPLAPERTYRVVSASFLAGAWTSAGTNLEDTGQPALEAVLGTIGGLPACPGSELPCIDLGSGAVQDGRINWN